MGTNNNHSIQIRRKNNKTLLPLIVKILITHLKNNNIYMLKVK